MSNGHQYTAEQRAWLAEHRPTTPMTTLVNQFNQRFGTDISKTALHGFCVRHGYHSTLTGRFAPGQKPWNLGKSGYMGANKTSFKPGNRPQSWRPNGSEVMHKDGYVYIKTDTGPVLKQRLIYEQINGPLPKGFVVVFLDGDRTNFNPDNLAAVHRRELAKLNRHEDFSNQPPAIKAALIATVRLEQTVKLGPVL